MGAGTLCRVRRGRTNLPCRLSRTREGFVHRVCVDADSRKETVNYRRDVSELARTTEPFRGYLSRRDRTALTPTELRCLTLAADGLSYKNIGGVLDVERCTIQRHLQVARYKLGARNTAQACVEAMRLGLIQ
jgi:DNA-binding CsgD family transcriptional regulator